MASYRTERQKYEAQAERQAKILRNKELRAQGICASCEANRRAGMPHRADCQTVAYLGEELVDRELGLPLTVEPYEEEGR